MELASAYRYANTISLRKAGRTKHGRQQEGLCGGKMIQRNASYAFTKIYLGDKDATAMIVGSHHMSATQFCPSQPTSSGGSGVSTSDSLTGRFS